MRPVVASRAMFFAEASAIVLLHDVLEMLITIEAELIETAVVTEIVTATKETVTAEIVIVMTTIAIMAVADGIPVLDTAV